MNIDELTQQERYDLLGKLLRLHVGAVKLDGTDNDWCVTFRQDVAPHCNVTATATPFLRFEPRKLIISEPVREIIEREATHERQPAIIRRTKNWLFGHERVEITDSDQIVRRIDHRHEVVQKRGIWLVQSAFVGNMLQFPTQANISGDEFGPDGELRFRTVCEPGLNVSLVIENTSDYPATFLAVLLGKNVDTQLKVA